MELRILGPLEVVINGNSIALGTTNEARLLSMLAAHANEIVPSARLIDGLWPGSPPRTARARLAAHVGNVREVLGSVGSPRSAQRWLLTEPPGYVLRVSVHELDAVQFTERCEAGRAALRARDFAEAADELSAGLELWRGEAYGELAGETFARADGARLEEARLTALEDRAEAALALGRHVDLCHELEALVDANPLRERLCRQLMLALYRSDRQADALRVAARFRQLVSETPGAEPTLELRQLEQEVLLQKPHLDWLPIAAREHTPVRPTVVPDWSDTRSPAHDADLDVVASTRSIVGRTAERQWLADRLDEAQRGKPQVVLLRGEAGVGKSRLARALVEEARERGITTSIGRFREQQSVPFGAFTGDFFRRLADAAPQDPELGVRAEILRSLATFGSGADTVASSEAERIAAVREGFAHLIRREPFVLLVDDVQWADAASCELLVNLVRLAADMGIHEPAHLLALLVVRDEPGVAELPELDLIRRENLTTSLTLHGLTELEVSKLANAIGARDLPLGVIGEITRLTRGNPLFAVAMVKQFAAYRNEWPHAEPSLPGRLPSEVQGLIGKRVAALSPACQEILAAAAVLGTAPDLDQLQAVTGIERAALCELLDEAERAEVLLDTGGSYDFAHPLYERAALAMLSSRRRQQTHRQIADVLIEQHASRPAASVIPIAEHLVAAGELADPRLLVEYCPTAGDGAFAGFAWGDAARYYEAALRASERLADDPDESRVRLALRASSARLQNGDQRAALRNADAAIAALGEDPAPEALATAWIERLRADLFEPGPGGHVDTGPLETLAGELETEAPRVAARVYSNLAPVYWAARRVEEARQACDRAIDLGSRYEEHVACAEGWGQLAVTQWMRLELADAVESLQAESLHAMESGDRQKLGHSTTLLPLTLVWMGRFDEAEASIEQARNTTREVSWTLRDGFVLVAQALIAAARGMYIESDAAVEDAIEIGRMTGYQWPTSLIVPILAATRSLRGDDEGTDAVLEQWAPPGTSPDRAAFAWLLRQRAAATAEHPATRDELEAIWKLFSSFPGMSTDTAAALVIEVAADIGEADLAVEPTEFLTSLAQRGQVFTTTMGLFIPRVLGVAAWAAGDPTRARALLQESIAVATELGAHAELAESQYALASVLAEDSDSRDAAVSLLETAYRSAGALGLPPLAARCADVAKQLGASRLGASDLDVEARGRTEVAEMVVVLFTDIADSVRLTEELGDWIFHDRARALQDTLRGEIRRFSGSPVDGITLGDGLLAEFHSAERAVSCAVACSALANEAGLPLHIGAHAGDVIRSEGDIFGGTVNTAARICSHAPAGEIRVSQTIRDLARTSSALSFTSLGPQAMKGIAEPVPLYSVHASR